MRKILIFIALLVATSIMASDIKYSKDFNTALKEATKLDKPVLFISSRHSCKYCVILKDTTLKNKDVVEALNKDFVSVVTYSDDNDYVPKELYHPGTPAIWFLLPSGEPMFQPIMGVIDVENFLNAIVTVKQEFADSKKGKK